MLARAGSWNYLLVAFTAMSAAIWIWATVKRIAFILEDDAGLKPSSDLLLLDATWKQVQWSAGTLALASFIALVVFRRVGKVAA